MRLVLAIFVMAMFSSTATATETRVRVSKGIRYDGFMYSGKHWLSGQAIAVSADTLVLRMTARYIQGEGIVTIPLSTVTEIQVRDTPETGWKNLEWPADEIEGLSSSLGLRISTAPSSTVQDEYAWSPIVAYVEDDGTEVLLVREGIPATITQEVRVRLGLFGEIRNFESAQYLRMKDGMYAIRLATYDESGMMHTVLKPASIAGLRALAAKGSGSGSQSVEIDQREYTMADGYTDGRIAAESRSTGGSFGGGLVCGVLTGLIGTGILWGATGGDEVPMDLISSYHSKGSDYAMGFANGYKEVTKQRKRGARLGGGLLGTAAFVMLFLVGN